LAVHSHRWERNLLSTANGREQTRMRRGKGDLHYFRRRGPPPSTSEKTNPVSGGRRAPVADFPHIFWRATGPVADSLRKRPIFLKTAFLPSLKPFSAHFMLQKSDFSSFLAVSSLPDPYIRVHWRSLAVHSHRWERNLLSTANGREQTRMRREKGDLHYFRRRGPPPSTSEKPTRFLEGDGPPSPIFPTSGKTNPVSGGRRAPVADFPHIRKTKPGHGGRRAPSPIPFV